MRAFTYERAADAASALGQLRMSPGWLLYLLLRGSFAAISEIQKVAEREFPEAG